MPYFPAGGGVAYQAPHVFRARNTSLYRQPARGTRGRFGESLSDILGTVSNVAGDISAGTSGGGGISPYGYGGSLPPSYYPPPAPASTMGLSTTALLLGAAVIGGAIYFGTKKR
jgi:hypothetical protein